MLLSEFCTSVIYVKKEAKGALNRKIVIFMQLCDFLYLIYNLIQSIFIFNTSLAKKEEKKWRFYAILICQFFRNVLRPHFLRF